MSSRRGSRRSAASAPNYADDICSASEYDGSDDGIVEADEKTTPSPETPKKSGSSATPISSATFKSQSKSGGVSDLKVKLSAQKKCKMASDEEGGIDIVIPSSLLGIGAPGSTARECTVLVQIDPEDASTLDFHGASGAVGRFEADDEGIMMDLKGFQYTGTINPGPTAMVASMTKGGQLKVESITDEFVTLRKTHDVMAQLDAVVEGDMDRSYAVTEVDVNRGGKSGDGDDGDQNVSVKKKKRAEKKPTGAPVSKKRRTSGAKGRKK